MQRPVCLLTFLILLASAAGLRAQDKTTPPKKLPTGIYAVRRDSLKEAELLPLKEGERLAVDRHRYVKGADPEPPRFIVVSATPDVALDLAAPPTAIKEGNEVVRILLKLKPAAATALARWTRAHQGKQLAILIGGEVVTIHKIRTVIPNGEVQITSCAAGAAGYLLRQLQTLP